jgi:hypothetical protein
MDLISNPNQAAILIKVLALGSGSDLHTSQLEMQLLIKKSSTDCATATKD